MPDENTNETTAQTGAPEPPKGPTMPNVPSPPRPSEIAGLLEKVFLMGVGAASLTKEKFDDFTSELVERGKVSQGDAKQVTDWMSEQARTQAAAVEKNMTTQTEKAIQEAGVATKKDIETLQEQILELKAMLASSRGASGS